MSNALVSTSDYIRGREALLIKVDLGDYLIDYYLHRKKVAPNTTTEQDERLKELIACFAIHLGARPPLEHHAWTLHMISEQPYSLFVTGNIETLDANGHGRGAIVGHVLTENIRHTDVHSLHAQFSNAAGKVFQSYVQFEGAEIAGLVEYYYSQSEQHPVRLYSDPASDKSLGLLALPDYDKSWFDAVELASLSPAPQEVKRMRSCSFAFRCECSPEKLLPFLRTLSEEELADLYGDDPEIYITCPRCGEHFSIDRNAVRAS